MKVYVQVNSILPCEKGEVHVCPAPAGSVRMAIISVPNHSNICFVRVYALWPMPAVQKVSECSQGKMFNDNSNIPGTVIMTLSRIE